MSLMGGFELPRTIGIKLKVNALSFLDFVDQKPLNLEASGEAAKTCDSWFAQMPRTLQIQSD